MDTAGFDDSHRQDGEIFTEITEFLAGQYALGIPLKGILYLHKIVDNRMTGSSQRYLGMLREICGDRALGNVILVTTMWNKIRDEDEGETLRREQELIGRFWRPMLNHGSSVSQFTGSTDSAFALVWELAGRNSVVLDIQTQLVDQELEVSQTTAGQQLSQKLREDETRYNEILLGLDRKLADCSTSGDRDGEKKAIKDKTAAEAVLCQIRLSRSAMGIKTGRNMKERIKDRMSGRAITTTISVFTAVLSVTLTLVKFITQ